LGWATHRGPSGPDRPRAAARAAALVFFMVLTMLLTPAAVGTAHSAMGEVDAKAAAVARELTDAMGGQAAWDTLPFLRFDFVVARDGKEVARFRHWWDRRRGRCRVEGPDEKGRVVTSLFNLSDRSGKSFTDGIADTDSANIANIIRMGYERWVGDTRWLVLPFALRDPGARLKYSGRKRGEGGVEWDVLEFAPRLEPGAKPAARDRYWLYVNRKSHLLDRWEFVLQDSKDPPQGSTWEEWTRVGPLKLSTLRRLQGRSVSVRFENLAVPENLDESVFTYARPKE